MNEEIWVESFEFPNYEVSDMGNIRRAKNNRVLKLAISSSSYVVARIYYNKKKYTKMISRMVWESFNGCKCKETIDHIDRNKMNNMLSNLRCISAKENSTNRNIYQRKYNITEEMKKEIINKIKNENISTVKIWKEYGIPTNYMSVILKRGTWNKYLDDQRTI